MWVRDLQVGIKLARTSEGVRGTFAPRAIAEGEYLAVIPLELAFQLPESSSAGVSTSTSTCTSPPTATCACTWQQPASVPQQHHSHAMGWPAQAVQRKRHMHHAQQLHVRRLQQQLPCGVQGTSSPVWHTHHSHYHIPLTLTTCPPPPPSHIMHSC